MSRLDRRHPPAPFAGTRAAPEPGVAGAGTGGPFARGTRDARASDVPAVGAARRRLALAASLVAGAAAASLLGGHPADIEPDLAVVLRVTAATKALIVLCIAAAVDWRLRHPIGPATAAALIAAAATALSGTALMVGLTEFHAGAALHYAGLGTLAVLAWRDRAAIAAILAARAADTSRARPSPRSPPPTTSSTRDRRRSGRA